MARTHDLVLYGATGFTGRLVAEQIREHADGIRWAIAGRRRDALQAIADELGGEVDIVVADAHDAQDMADLAASTKVVCTTVGPYAEHGSLLVEACAEAGTDYCDLTGELPWIRRMIDAHHKVAVDSGARILHCCGFDSIPFDLGVVHAQRAFHETHGVWAGAVSGRLKAARGGASGGTVHSMLGFMEEAARDGEVRRVVADPYGLNPDGERHGPDTGERLLPRREEDFDGWSGPFVMSAINTRVVRRTHALLGYPWGEGFRYDEAVLTGTSPLGAVGAAGMGALIGSAGLAGMAMRFGPVRRLIERVVPDPGTGPSPEAQRKGFFDVRFVATHPQDPTVQQRTKVVGTGDPGYGSTSRMLAQTALALAHGEAEVGGGSWTPGAALGDALLRRLPERADVTFTVLG